jgi:hypothetical protein
MKDFLQGSSLAVGQAADEIKRKVKILFTTTGNRNGFF